MGISQSDYAAIQIRLARNKKHKYEDNREPQSAVVKPAVCHESVATKEGERINSKRVHVGIVSYRRRLCDVDNLCGKYFLDCCRYAGLIQDDAPDKITYTIRQEKVTENERTEITID